jgi:uncharacterized protein (TIGR02996 family)
MSTLDALLFGIVGEPQEETRWLVLADWLDEYDDPRRGELLRLHRRLLATCCEPDAHSDRATWQSRIVELIAEGVRPCVPQETFLLPGGVPITVSFIPPGTFLMGGRRGDRNQRPVHTVELPRGFFLGVHPVTQVQWQAVMGDNPSHFKASDRPVESVTWDECRAFCAAVSDATGRVARFPTEGEWEYACRAGTDTDYYTGDGAAVLERAGWYKSNAEDSTSAVGQLVPNAWGLSDMHGNVRERCLDAYAPYTSHHQIDAAIEPREYSRVYRGGGWCDTAWCCRSANRWLCGPGARGSALGFRVVLLPGDKHERTDDSAPDSDIPQPPLV